MAYAVNSAYCLLSQRRTYNHRPTHLPLHNSVAFRFSHLTSSIGNLYDDPPV